jgi:hypothetical protein
LPGCDQRAQKCDRISTLRHTSTNSSFFPFGTCSTSAMTSTVLEATRAAHERMERLEAVAVQDLMEKAKTVCQSFLQLLSFALFS